MPSARVQELKRTLDRLVGEPDLEYQPPPEEQVVFDEAIRNFRSRGPELLDEATEPLWAYYRRAASDLSPAEREDYGIPEVMETADIWDELDVSSRPPTWSLGGQRFMPGRSYVSFAGGVSWEPEHGLQLVFEHGLRVCKVGPCDGHFTNAHAYADESLLGVVFA